MVPSPLKDCMTLTPSSPGPGHFHQSAPFPKQLQKANTCRGAQGTHSITPRCPTTRSCCACGCVPAALPRLPAPTAPLDHMQPISKQHVRQAADACRHAEERPSRQPPGVLPEAVCCALLPMCRAGNTLLMDPFHASQPQKRSVLEPRRLQAEEQ